MSVLNRFFLVKFWDLQRLLHRVQNLIAELVKTDHINENVREFKYTYNQINIEHILVILSTCYIEA